MMFFVFQGHKVLLKAIFEGTPGLLAQAGSIFWIRALAASSLSTCGSDTVMRTSIQLLHPQPLLLYILDQFLELVHAN